MKNNPTKQKVINAASSLFFQKGFHGTSVRDIADKASVNVSLISYYFKGKQGLLEHAVTNYYETYLTKMEEALSKAEMETPIVKLKLLIDAIIQYKQNNHQFSCFIHRELSIDSIFVREMAVTYLAKENYFISNTFTESLPKCNKSNMEQQFLLMQLKGMLITPYVLQNEWKNQVVGKTSHDLFAQNYTKVIHKWIDFITSETAQYANH
ncbi:TetR family transcriptional regulator [Virgibacillus phasianinus]|uniref:TetR family transcriptional regulator n=1 Tax=Virgibacillus phasianinus TaxID=2017483 RepID=A0A220U4M3_9BACI|nr:forespore capture DNA-binding protein RefZ [Virgibacillus phasianinus]ASK62942.1 TetR family transcriptional regulator [Virgibacillus phasianinus]